MGQFKPMVKMGTTEPSVILKLKKGGHVSANKDENGHTNMKGAAFKAKYSEEACEGESPKKPSVSDRRKAMSGALLNSKKGGKVEKKAMGGMMGAPAMPAPAMDPRKAAMMRAMMARRATPAAPMAAPMAAPAAPGMAAMKKGGKAKHEDAAQDRAMIKKAMAGKKFASGGKISAVMDKTTVKGNEGAFTKTKMATVKKDSGYEKFAAGGTVEGNEGAFVKTKMATAKRDPGYEHYAKGGAAKKRYATGGSVSTGSAVAMPKHPVSKPVSNTAQSGTFKKGGTVKMADGGSTDDGGSTKNASLWTKINPTLKEKYLRVNEPTNPRYSEDAVNKAIGSSNRSGRKISGKEAKAIHALLRGGYAGGGTVKTADGDMTDLSGGAYDKYYSNLTDENTRDREAILGLPSRAYAATKRLLGIKPDAGAGRGNVNPPLVNKAGGGRAR